MKKYFHLELLSIATACILLIASVSAALTWDYLQTLSRAENNLSTGSELLAAHAALVLRDGDRSIDHVLGFVAKHDLSSIDDTVDSWAQLSSIAGNLPSKVGLWILDAYGNVVFTTSAFPAPHINYAYRNYFRKLAGGEPSYISGVHTRGIDGARFFTIGRRIEGPNGSFGGVVAVNVSTAYFADFYTKLGLDKSSRVVMARDDGSLLLLEPSKHDIVQARFDLSLPAGIDKKLLYEYSGLERRLKILAVHRVKGYPITITLSLPKSKVIEAWKMRAAITILTMTAAVALLLVFGYLTFKARDRERKALVTAENRAVELANALGRNDLLMSELQHRTQNNMQLMLSLLQMGESQHGGENDVFKSTARRIRALTMAQRMLDGMVPDDCVDLHEYLSAISYALIHAEEPRKTTLKIDIEKIMMPIKIAQALGLITNELLTNSIKYAFCNRAHGLVTIGLKTVGDHYILEYSDNGVGISNEVVNDEKPRGRGLRLVDAIGRQIGGEISVAGNNGFRFSLSFIRPELRQNALKAARRA